MSRAGSDVRRVTVFALLAVMSFVVVWSQIAAAVAPASLISNGTTDATTILLVKFKASVDHDAADAAIRTSGAVSVRELAQLRLRVIKVSRSERENALDALARNPDVERVQPARTFRLAADPNDPLYAEQWQLPKIAWPAARDGITIGGHAKIAILDTGIDATIADLAGRTEAGQSFTGGDSSADPNGHGTALAAIAAANVNESTGIAGVAYAGVTVSSVQVLRADGPGAAADIL